MSGEITRVLLVDDDEDDYILTRGLLGEAKQSSYRLSWSRSYQDGLKTACRREDHICLVDYRLGKRSGVELIREARRSGVGTPMILLTGQGDYGVDVEAMRAGADDYLVKDEVTAALLERAIRYAIERHKTVGKLEELAAIVESSDDAIMGKTLEGVITSWNRGAEKMYGYAAEEIVGKSVYDLVPPERRDEVKQILERLKKGEAVERLETVRVRKDGTTVDVSVTISPIKDQAGMIIGASSIARDITERRRAEAALKEAEERYRGIFENAVEGLFQSAPDGRFISANPSLARILGFDSPEELIARRTDLATQHYVDPAYRAVLEKLLAEQGVVAGFECEVFRKDGSSIWVVENIRAVRDEKGALLCYEGSIEDITERKRAEEALRHSEAQFRALFENALDAVLIANDRAVYVDANPAACELLGVPREEILGRRVHDFVEVDDPSEVSRLWEEFLRAGVMKGPIRLRRPDGKTINVDYSARADFLPGRHLSVLRDITERRALEEQLRQSQKMEAVGCLAGGVAHDFNNLLTAISGYSELGVRKLREGDPLLRNLEEIRKAAERAASLTGQLLAFSRRQILRPKVLNLNDVISDMEKMLRRLIGEDVELRTILDQSLGSVRADPGQIEQVLMNLAVNARDAMPEGGKLTVETKNVHLDQDYASRHITVTPGPYVMLAVSDTGTGMDEETRAHIFEPFFTTKEQGKGTGLGLSTVYGIVKQSGGYIWVYSEVGVGTTFKIYLPRVDEGAEEYRGAEAPFEVPRGTETILLAEDEDVVRKLAREVLEAGGYTVLEAASGGSALLTCERHRGPIHLLVSDVVMPEMSGRELAARLAEVRPEMKVLYMSGYTNDAIVHRGVLAEGTNFIQKPFRPDELLRKVRGVLDEAGGPQVPPE